MAKVFQLNIVEIEDTNVSINVTVGRNITQVTIGLFKDGEFPIYRWDTVDKYQLLAKVDTFEEAKQRVWEEAISIGRELG